jgi:flavin-dependent dehydrogenase
MTDILIAGGGLAGSAAAIALARAGRRVTLLERETGPKHKICGEFISTEAQAYLRVLGVDPLALPARPTRRCCGVRHRPAWMCSAA